MLLFFNPSSREQTGPFSRKSLFQVLRRDQVHLSIGKSSNLTSTIPVIQFSRVRKPFTENTTCGKKSLRHHFWQDSDLNWLK